MEQLLTNLSHAVEGAPAIALAASVIWGVLSIVLSPCHLASIPLIVGFISEQGQVTVKRAYWTSTLFAVGILITIAAIGAITAAAGRMMGDVGRYGNYFVALIFFVVGLHLVGVIPLSFSGPGQVDMKRKGMLAAFILGLVFGVALGPCTFAYMAPMLAVTFQLSGDTARYGVVPFISFMALLSINLGLINLFPVPMLDGGHLLFYGIEAVRGKPLGERAQEIGFRIGLAVVLALMLFVTFNDLVNLPVFEFVKKLIT